jgi:hypothetical protein
MARVKRSVEWTGHRYFLAASQSNRFHEHCWFSGNARYTPQYRFGLPNAAVAAIVLAMGLENAVFQIKGGAGLGLTYVTGALAPSAIVGVTVHR